MPPRPLCAAITWPQRPV